MEPKQDSGPRDGTDPFALQRVGSRNMARVRGERQGGSAQDRGNEWLLGCNGNGELRIVAEEW